MEKESLTSLISAFSRAYHSQFDTPKIFDDDLAKELISQAEFDRIKENMIQGISFFSKEIEQRLEGNPDEILKWITQVQLAPTPLARAAYCEQVLALERVLGAKQYVILGAGLDTFCFRHPELEKSLEIFELDHPTTQESKKQRLERANLRLPSNLHLIPMDFTQEFSYQKLIDAGFKNEKTFFSLLGVSYYLTKEDLLKLITQLFANVPSGSSIVLDYADEQLFVEKGIANRVDHIVKMAAASGEPMKSCFSYDEIEHLMEEAGLLIYEHLTPSEINKRYFSNRTDYLTAFETIHYIYAVKQTA
jgi:methyltransferase (TIGR00027 family)